MPLESFHGEWHPEMATFHIYILVQSSISYFPYSRSTVTKSWQEHRTISKEKSHSDHADRFLGLKNWRISTEDTRPSKKSNERKNISNPKPCHRETHLCIDGGGTWSLPVIISRLHSRDSPEDTKPSCGNFWHECGHKTLVGEVGELGSFSTGSALTRKPIRVKTLPRASVCVHIHVNNLNVLHCEIGFSSLTCQRSQHLCQIGLISYPPLHACQMIGLYSFI